MVTARATARTWVKRAAVGVGVICLVLAGVYGFACWWGVQIPIDVRTTRVLGPVGADGRIDYAAAIDAAYSAGVTAENNAAVLMLVAVGSTGLSEISVGELLTRMGAEGAEVGRQALVTTKVWAEGRGVDDGELDQAIETAGLRPWSAEQASGDFEEVGAYLKENRAALDLLVEAGRRERYWWPVEKVPGEPLALTRSEALNEMRNASRLLVARSMMRAGGEPERAMEDALTVVRLGNHLQRGSSLIGFLFGTGTQSIGYKAVGRLLNGAPDACLGDASEAVAADGVFDALMRVLDLGERYHCLQGTYEVVPASQYAPFQWGNAMRTMNTRLDEILVALKLADHGERRARMNVMIAESRQRKGYLENLNGALFADILTPSLARSAEITGRLATEEELLRVAIGVEKFMRKAEKYPATLGEAGIAGAMDFLTGAVVVYRPEEKGFVVYSVGENGVDDGGFGRGDWETNEAASKTADDVAVRVE